MYEFGIMWRCRVKMKTSNKSNKTEKNIVTKTAPKNHRLNGIGGGEHSFTFIDLFAGIGGFRLAMQKLGGKCVFSSEWDSAAKETYYENYGEVPYGDITLDETKNLIPYKFDVLCAGFPCQAFLIDLDLTVYQFSKIAS